MAILYPLMLPASWKLCMEAGMDHEAALAIFHNVVSCVLAGSVLGDHCSPISDTTILSSLATACDHVEHVKTQIPYALTVGGVALFVGIIPTALGLSPWIAFPLGIAILYFIIRVVGRKPI
jgi:Na+/H+ antiporter NhaC